MDASEPAPECPNCRRLTAIVEAQARQLEALRVQIRRLEAAIAELQRAGKRQAAPFRKKKKEGPAQKPGRKPGEDYGQHHRRSAPDPAEIDETYDAPLPPTCPCCGSPEVRETHVASQYQIELPSQPIQREFLVHVGRCDACGVRVQGRHELQTSDALGAAAVQFGPRLHAAAALANKELGLSHGKFRRLMKTLFGIVLSRSTSVRSAARTARRAEPAYQEIREAVRGSPQVVPDETGWRIAAVAAWLHAFVAASATYYEIVRNRGSGPAEELLGLGWAGVLTHDGWAPYDKFRAARHQQCTAHLLRRCDELLQTAVGGAVRFPRRVQELLQAGFAARAGFRAGELSQPELDAERVRLERRLGRLVAPVKQHAGNERLAKFLEKHLSEIFFYLTNPDVIDATNYRAEQAIRPAVVNRKVWGGNRTDVGARTQAVLMSVIRTCLQRGAEPFEYLARLLTSPTPPPLPAGR